MTGFFEEMDARRKRQADERAGIRPELTDFEVKTFRALAQGIGDQQEREGYVQSGTWRKHIVRLADEVEALRNAQAQLKDIGRIVLDYRERREHWASEALEKIASVFGGQHAG